MGKRIKYMGSADVAIVHAGHDFNGRLNNSDTAFPNTITWDWENRHTVDWAETGASDAALTLLLEDEDRFLDVTDHELIPTSLAEQLWQAMPATKVDPETIAKRAGLSAQPTLAEQEALLAPSPALEEPPPVTTPVTAQADEVATRSPDVAPEDAPEAEADPEPKPSASKAPKKA